MHDQQQEQQQEKPMNQGSGGEESSTLQISEPVSPEHRESESEGQEDIPPLI
jgi:hypothetical protein